MVGRPKRTSPRDYIRLAVELHLQSEIDSSCEDTVLRFLNGGNINVSNQDDVAVTESPSASVSNPRLFVWVPNKREKKGGDEPHARASNDALDANNMGAIAFLNTQQTSGKRQQQQTAVKSSSQIHCMTLSPRVYAGEDDDETDDEKTEKNNNEDASDGIAQNNPGTTTFNTLQMYTRHCFFPAVRAVEALAGSASDDDIPSVGESSASELDDGDDSEKENTSKQAQTSKNAKMLENLEEKIRDLDIALGQSRRSLGIPHVNLRSHQVLTTASKKIPASGKIDFDKLGLTAKVSDDSFLNEVQSGVSQWIVQIQKVTELPTTTPFPASGDALEEVSFWRSLETAISGVKSELQKPDVLLTISLLKSAKRFLATIALENNTGLEAAEKHAVDVASFLREFPIENLASARDMSRIGNAVEGIFDHIPKIRQSRFYDLERVAKLLEATTRIIAKQMTLSLRDKYKQNGIILALSFAQYEKVYAQTNDIFNTFDDRYEQFTEFFLDQGRKRRLTSEGSTTKTPLGIIKGLKLAHLALRERLDEIYTFRTQHHKLRIVVSEVLGGSDGGLSGLDDPVAVKDVEEAPLAFFATIDVLDLSPRSAAEFGVAIEAYDRRIDAIEERLARLLRDKLTAAQDAEEMFRVFARFHALLARTRVRSAVKDFQIQLISTVGLAIQKLQSKFTHKYEASSANQVAHFRGIPPVAGKIMWAKQMERQVQTLMKRMGDVLGENWGHQLEGRALRKTGDELLSKLDPKRFLRDWVKEWEKELLTHSSSRVKTYPIIISRDSVTEKLVATVNFDERSEQLFREVRYLMWLGYEKDVPATISILSDEALTRYPHATALKAALRSYSITRALITPELEPLVFPRLLAIRGSIEEAFDVTGSDRATHRRRTRWETSEMGEWVSSLSELVSRFEERVEKLLRACEKIDDFLIDLGLVPFDAVELATVVENIQKIIDELSLAGYADLSTWVVVVDKKMGDVLTKRLEEGLKQWISVLNHNSSDSADTIVAPSKLLKGNESIAVANISVEILLRNQEISASPSVPSVRSLFIDNLHQFIGTVCCLSRPASGRFEVFANHAGDSTNETTEKNSDNYYFQLIEKVDSELLANAYATVEIHMVELNSFVQQWLAYQNLWDTRVHDVTVALGDNVDQWQQMIVNAKDARTALDSSSNVAQFGPVTVRYDKVQNQVNLKYDLWQRELQAGFAELLETRVVETHDLLASVKAKLEAVSLEGSTGNIVIGVTYLQEMTLKAKQWAKDTEKLCECERLLKKQRHTFKGDWMEASRAKGQFTQFEHILLKRNKSMSEQIPVLQQRVLAEDKLNSQRVSDLMSTWEAEKPLRGNMAPADALEVLAKYEVTMQKSCTDFDNLSAAKDALGLDSSGENLVSESLDELNDLKEVWDAVNVPYSKLEELKEVQWNTLVPRKTRKSLEDLGLGLRSLPNRVRQYDGYTFLNDTIKKYLADHSVLSDLKTDALKDRHWKTILSRLGIRVPYSAVTVGHLWDGGILTRKKEMGEILVVAQGEMALEQFLQQVKDMWGKQELELVLYKNRVRLIRGWDNLFTALDDHMGGLVLMRSSPYYRAVRDFQDEGNTWEDRLTKLRGSFDAWVDVQRRWVYLEGILFGSADIKAQLPAEYSRFKGVDKEFVAIMKRISQKPYAMEALSIDNLQKTLERLGNLMFVIQRALGEYLEKQRSDFSRFYFLGDDDLLEIVGSSGEPVKVLSHVGKMFAGLATATHSQVSEEDKETGVLARLDAMTSKDGESVPLDESIDITTSLSVKQWLKKLEDGMQITLAKLLQNAVNEDVSSSSALATDEGKNNFVEWTKKFPGQVMILAALVKWSTGVNDGLLSDGKSEEALTSVLQGINAKLEVMAESVLLNLPHGDRQKFEQLITELVHQRDVTRSLLDDKVSSAQDFRWLYHLRFNYNPKAQNLIEQLSISLSNANFFYGFEYLGIGNRLVQTPLTDRCYLTLTQALHFRMGGNPYGPAGTGKTESVKALGAQLGRFVLVMNCDETFDFGAMGRLFCGLCQVGAWGCFDEFNRLEERILSAVSQQILTIQRGLIEDKKQIEILGRSIRLNGNVGIFVTMNPGYAGRSNMPDNLKTLFRGIAMVVPDRKLIAQVMLFSQGFVSAEKLSGKVVSIFDGCKDILSNQGHYDFGLRALKTLLVSAGALKRKELEGKSVPEGEDIYNLEESVLIAGACNNIVPKLIAVDLVGFNDILKETFPGSEISSMDDKLLRKEIEKICEDQKLIPDESWMQKVLQLKQVLDMRHGVMTVGPVGVGKSSALRVLMQALENSDGTKGEIYIIDPKAMDKNGLYGVLDGTTMEWTDGVFTSLLRSILANLRGESEKRHWIVFDGDVDPEWAENLNSVLDDNKMLTLPSGERLTIPDNVRILMEVDSLAEATPATVSRCGMIWFSENTVSESMCFHHLLGCLRKPDAIGLDEGEEASSTQLSFVDAIEPMVLPNESSGSSTSLCEDALEFAMKATHVMQPSRERLLGTFEILLCRGIEMAVEYDENHPDFPMSGDHMESFAKRWLLHSLLWSFVGSAKWDVRTEFGEFVLSSSGITLPGNGGLADYRVKVEDGEHELWSESVPRVEIESQKVTATDVVVTTTDTVRHVDVIGSWLASRKPLILCGPPGSGKTMTLTSVLNSVQDIVLASLNFSSRTTPEIILKVFEQYCQYVRKGKRIVLEPVESLGLNKWLVVFCDEINLPEEDSYGTQRVIMFIRQLVEQGGFWRGDNVWVTTSRIQFIGACNPPEDAGRYHMSHRFMRHAPLLLVDFPSKVSLLQIYGTFCGGMMKLFPNLRGESEALTQAMVELYLEAQAKFTPEMQPQYFFSPRELSRWIRGIYEATVSLDQGLTREELVRIWAHEATRLFCDRLVEEDEKKWCDDKIDEVAKKYFAGVNFEQALARPMYYSSWLSKDSRSVSREELKAFLIARLRVFYEEELDVPLVVFDEVLEHILRIDRVLRQPMGHCLLVGDAGAGKTVLSKFVSWMNGQSIFQIKAHSRYGLDEFNEDLRAVMRRVGVDGEKVCFIFDEGNALGSGFLEAMNALLASGEVPGLFEGDELTALMNAVRDSAQRDGEILNSDEELWKRFTKIVQRNLHVVFTMNPSGGEWKNRSTTSPALFNRCVVDWFGTWGGKAMGEVGKEFTSRVDVGDADAGDWTWGVGEGEEVMNVVAAAFGDSSNPGLRQAVVAVLVDLHQTTKDIADECAALDNSACRTYLSPRDYIALIENFVSCVNERRAKVEGDQVHINAGLSKLRQTQDNVAEMEVGLAVTGRELREKETLANNKLQQMVADQNVAEKRKVEAERMNIAVAKQQVEITTRKEEAQRELDEAEPALLSAQAAVKGIRKKDLDEVRRMARPPINVKLTLECVAIMMGEKSIEWKSICKMLSTSDFIPGILAFDADLLKPKQVQKVTDNYLDGNEELTTEKVARSSKACGPLYKWAESQVKYSRIYNNVQPLREEVIRLESEAEQAKTEKDRIVAEVAALEDSIGQYKTDYALLIRDVESLKTEMINVKKKVDRAGSLIKSLSYESERWASSSEGFQEILKSLVGDGLLLAAFLTYSGFFDFKTRIVLMKKWRSTLDAIGIEYRSDLSVVESLSKAADRLKWTELGLQSDSLSTENGVILSRCVRFPLVIDPSGQAIAFIMNKYSDQKVQKTSFLDKSFMKTLAGAVRFGTTLLVENVENIDPVLNPILNREIQKTGGRSLVRIGTEDVDYSPKFNVILTTKNPAAKLTPDLCSRVTLVNFTVTPASLESQSMTIILKGEKPEVEEQRTNVLKLQGEQNVKMRELEEQMLSKISAVEGNILDDDRVVEGMEVLMKEGGLVEEQIAKSAQVMTEVQIAISKFEPLAKASRKLFVLLEAMRNINFLYEFSAKFFKRTLMFVLKNCVRHPDENDDARLTSVTSAVFRETCARVGRGLKSEDKMVFALLLCQALKGENAVDLSGISSFDELPKIIENVFGLNFPWQGRGLNDLKLVTENDIDCSTPLMLVSAPGHDVSGRVEEMARRGGFDLSGVAMGSPEGFDSADKMIAAASRRGTWVMLKNCHLCIDWVGDTLVKKLQSLNAHQDFRIFITSEISPKLPTSLLRMSDIILAEAPTGIKATLSRFFSNIPPSRFTSTVKNRLYLSLGWIHAVVQERLRYVPTGWTEGYEFTENDASHGLDVIDALVDKAQGGKKNVSPDKVPFEALRATLCKSIFGNRVTDPKDQDVLDNLVNSVFTSECFDVDFHLVQGTDALSMPEGSTMKEINDWIDALPSHSPTTWAGLDSGAEAERERLIAESVVKKVKQISEHGEG